MKLSAIAVIWGFPDNRHILLKNRICPGDSEVFLRRGFSMPIENELTLILGF